MELGVMLVKSESDCEQFVANDGCLIRELLHPRNDPVDIDFSFAIAEVAPGGTTYRHRLAQTEVYYLISGRGIMHIDGDQRPVSAGDAILIPPRSTQWIENASQKDTLKFAAVVAPPWRDEDDERL